MSTVIISAAQTFPGSLLTRFPSNQVVDSTNSGFLTLAFGERYAEMAIDLALSVKEFHSEPISIGVDVPTRAYLARYQPSPFDQIISLPQKVHAWGAKFLVA